MMLGDELDVFVFSVVLVTVGTLALSGMGGQGHATVDMPARALQTRHATPCPRPQ